MCGIDGDDFDASPCGEETAADFFEGIDGSEFFILCALSLSQNGFRDHRELQARHKDSSRAQSKRGKDHGQGGEYKQGLLLGLLEDPPVLKVVDIYRVEDLVVTSPAIYYFLLLISDHEGRIAALGALGDTGLYFGSGVVTEKTKVPLPFQSEKSVEKIVSRAAGPIRMEKMERIAVHSSISSYPFVPLNRITTSKGVFIVDFLDRVYAIEKEEYWNRHTMKIPDQRLGHITIQDGMNDRIIYLKKIDGGR